MIIANSFFDVDVSYGCLCEVANIKCPTDLWAIKSHPETQSTRLHNRIEVTNIWARELRFAIEFEYVAPYQFTRCFICFSQVFRNL